VRTYKPQYKDPAKFWARVGMIWVTHLDTNDNPTETALLEINDLMEKAKSKSTKNESP
jgi:hypothetical protein